MPALSVLKYAKPERRPLIQSAGTSEPSNLCDQSQRLGHSTQSASPIPQKPACSLNQFTSYIDELCYRVSLYPCLNCVVLARHSDLNGGIWIRHLLIDTSLDVNAGENIDSLTNVE